MLDIQDLHVALDAEAGLVRAIDGLRLSMQRGETFALVGESGCGKSMTALALMRLLPDNGRITHGTIRLEGQDTLALPESQMRTVRGGRISMIFQEPGTSLNPVMKVGQQLVEAIETHTELRGNAARSKAIEWLKKVGIPEPERRIDDYPFRMSGGQKQRVMIAMALATEPDFLVADEPTTALDVTIQKQVLDLLRDLQQEQGMGMLLITHDLAVVSGMAHRVALMYAGQIIEVASAQEFFSTPHHPYAQALLRALPESQRRGEPLTAIAGTVPPLNQEFIGCRFAPRCASALPSCANKAPSLESLSATRSVRCVLHAQGMASQHAVRPAPAVEQAPDDRAQTARVESSAVRSQGNAGPLPSFLDPLGGPDATRQVWGRSQGNAGPLPSFLDPLGGPDATRQVWGRSEPVETLKVNNLHVRFPIRQGLLQRVTGHFHAVKDVSFTIRSGQTVALVGESGCGKTTTGKALVQLLRGQANIRGTAKLGGRNLFELQGDDLRAARRDIQIIFQDPFASLNPRMRVFDILEEGLVALRPEMDASARRAHLERLADQVGLRKDALERYPHEFSGGQRQRIAIARALAVQPKLIICDEPTSALDVSVQAQILNLLKQLQDELGLSYLLITHNIGVVEYIAEEVAVMRGGQVVESGAAQTVLQHPAHEYTYKLLSAVPRLGQVGH